MRRIWELPTEKDFSYTGKDWLLHLLSRSDDSMRSRILLLLWRSWHLRNDVVHEKGNATVASAVAFLRSYHHDSRHNPSNSDTKGKRPAEAAPLASSIPAASPHRWAAPPVDWVKLNTDGAFRLNSRGGGAGAAAC
uniref:Uncharacterized protein n=1 Tax=Avena sativa TaxID=4498 RepID=A0ACD5XW65_AVESA